MLGFTLSEVKTLLRLVDERDRPCAEVRDLAAAHLQNVQAKLADLRGMEAVLKDMVITCDTGQSTECPLIERMFDEQKLI